MNPLRDIEGYIAATGESEAPLREFLGPLGAKSLFLPFPLGKHGGSLGDSYKAYVLRTLCTPGENTRFKPEIVAEESDVVICYCPGFQGNAHTNKALIKGLQEQGFPVDIPDCFRDGKKALLKNPGFAEQFTSIQNLCKKHKEKQIILVGHSTGGLSCVHALSQGLPENVIGVVPIDSPLGPTKLGELPVFNWFRQIRSIGPKSEIWTTIWNAKEGTSQLIHPVVNPEGKIFTTELQTTLFSGNAQQIDGQGRLHYDIHDGEFAGKLVKATTQQTRKILEMG